MHLNIKMIPTRYTLIFILFQTYLINAQNITVDDNFTATQLVEQFLINNPCANVSNVQVSGHTFDNGDKSYGYFNQNGSNFPFQEGVVITNGRAKSAIGPNTTLLSEGPSTWLGDADLEAAINETNTFNATVLSFDFLPLTNKISFDYIFSSEQYLAYANQNQCRFSDGFAFLLKEANTNQPYQNLAVVPGTNTPVKVTTVRGSGTICQPMNELYFDAFNGTNHPTNYNGQTKILKAVSTVNPGVLYHIKLVIADQGNPLYDSAIFFGGGSFEVGIDLGADLLIANQNALCSGTVYTLDATIPNALSYQWFKDGIAIPNPSSNPAFYEVETLGFYEVEVTLSNSTCVLFGEVMIEYYPEPILTPVISTNCGSNNSNIFNLNQVFIDLISSFQSSQSAFYLSEQDAINDQNRIIDVNNFQASNNSLVYIRIGDSATNCTYYHQALLQVNNISESILPFLTCDEDSNKDGLTNFNLNTSITPLILQNFTLNHQVIFYLAFNDALSQNNPLPNNFTNTIPFNQTIYARVSLNNNCEDIIAISLTIEAVVIDEPITKISICPNNLITLNAPFISGASYLWQNGQTSPSITVNQPGSYEVTITTINGCTNSKTFTVVSIESFEVINIEQSNFQNNNFIHIFTSGNPFLEYSIDGVNFQVSPIFNNLSAGIYQVMIRDVYFCYQIIKKITILDYPRFFTPNGDGVNDFWGIKHLPSNALVNIFDRFGKLITILRNNQTWDGKYMKQILPSSDYWFTLEIDGEIIYRNHFSLKR